MRKTKIFAYFFFTLTLLSCESCEVIEIDCKGFDRSNAILDYTMFQEKKNNYNFINQQNDTIKLSYFDRSFSESYIERCGGFADPNCACYSGFEELYKVNDSIFFRTQITASILEGESEFIDISYSVNSSRYNERQIINSFEKISDKFNEITQEELILANYEFNNVIQVILNKHENDKSLIEQLVIKKNEGLIAFMNNNKLYLKEK